MYNQQLEHLIDAALKDGQLTEKEKQIIFKKAESLGIPLDEVEMVLEARLFEKVQQSGAAAPQSDKFGDIRKCPACGALAESFATKCSDCGTEFLNLQASQNVTRFFDKLDELERSRTDSPFREATDSSISFGTLMKWLFFYWILLPMQAINVLRGRSRSVKWTTTDVRKDEMIMNFPVSNSREEIFEFVTLALSKIDVISYGDVVSDKGKYQSAWNAVWLKKLEQINTKASLAMKNDKKSYEEIVALVNEGRQRVRGNRQRLYHLVVGFVGIVALLVIYAKVRAALAAS